MKRPLNPSSEKAYRTALLHCFGGVEPPFNLQADLTKVSQSRMTVVHSATRWACARAGVDAESVLAKLPALEWRVQEAIEIPTEKELFGLEKIAGRILPIGKRAAALLPLSMGLRASEVITLKRDWVERGYSQGELKVLRKGGKEQILPAKNALLLFEELLGAQRALPKRSIEDQMKDLRSGVQHGSRPWTTVGQVLSTGTVGSQYHALYESIQRLGEELGVKGLRPHKLRHVFATRMINKGASIAHVQWMLGHAHGSTTLRYMHVTLNDVEKYL